MKTTGLVLATGFGLAVASVDSLAQVTPSVRLPQGPLRKVVVGISPKLLPKLAPGIYESRPYSCIVVVPGPQADDRALVTPGGPGFRMPTIRPDLRLLPRIPSKPPHSPK